MNTRRALFLSFALLAGVTGVAQQRLPNYPGVREGQAARQALASSVSLARTSGWWQDNFTFIHPVGNDTFAFDARTGQRTALTARPTRPAVGGGGRQPGRGRQFTTLASPDGSARADYKDGNLSLTENGRTTALSQDGDEARGIKYGSASWVYGEELAQNEAFGFSPNSRYVWFYRFDEIRVPIYYLTLNQRDPQSTLATERYPKPGQPNPEVELYVFDRQTRQTTRMQVRPGAFDEGVGHYIFRIGWLADGRLYFRRADRRQQVLELCASDPTTGITKVLQRETNPEGWVDGDFPMFPVGNDRLLSITERNGFANWAWVGMDGTVTPLTSHQAEVRRPVHFDDQNQVLFYMALDGKRHGAQLWRVGYNGQGAARLTDPELAHQVMPSPDGQFFVVTSQSDTVPPVVRIIDRNGQVKATVAESNVEGITRAGYRRTEALTFTSADGRTELNARLHYPVNFDPNKKYPMILPVYGGPLGAFQTSWNPSFELPDSYCDYGFFVLEVENRGPSGRGVAFKNAMYRHMGRAEIDDMAKGVEMARTKPGVDGNRVGIIGTSYGGYTSIMAILRYPDHFHAAVSNSNVSDWRNYDTTYTERYMDLLERNVEGYDAGRAATYAANLKGALMIYYGTADDNTHPTNSLQIIAALQRAGKSFEVQVGPDAGHSAVSYQRSLEFLIENLILRPATP